MGISNSDTDMESIYIENKKVVKDWIWFLYCPEQDSDEILFCYTSVLFNSLKIIMTNNKALLFDFIVD